MNELVWTSDSVIDCTDIVGFARVHFTQLLVVPDLGGLAHNTPWSESASELYRPSDRRVSTK
jgi:hypothetical protein